MLDSRTFTFGVLKSRKYEKFVPETVEKLGIT